MIEKKPPFSFDTGAQLELAEIAEHLKALVEHAQKARSQVWLHAFGGVLAGALGALIIFVLQDFIHTQRVTEHPTAPVVQVQPQQPVPVVHKGGRSGR